MKKAYRNILFIISCIMEPPFYDVMLYETLFVAIISEMIVCSRLETIFRGVMICYVAKTFAWFCCC